MKKHSLRKVMLLILFIAFSTTTVALIAQAGSLLDDVDRLDYNTYTDSDEFMWQGKSDQEEPDQVEYNIRKYKDSIVTRNKSLYASTSKVVQNPVSGTWDLIGSGDDPIVNIVPKSLLTAPGVEVFHIGNEYGFYVETYADINGAVHSIVYVFDIINITEVDKNNGHIEIEVVPLFQMEYVYLERSQHYVNYLLNPTNFDGPEYAYNGYSYAEKNNIVVALPYILGNAWTPNFNYGECKKYYMSDIKGISELHNETQKNVRDAGYSVYDDKGAFFIQIDSAPTAKMYHVNEKRIESALYTAWKILIDNAINSIKGVSLIRDIWEVLESTGDTGTSIEGKLTYKSFGTTSAEQITQKSKLIKAVCNKIKLNYSSLPNGSTEANSYLMYELGDSLLMDYMIAYTPISKYDSNNEVTGYEKPWSTRFVRGLDISLKSYRGTAEKNSFSSYTFPLYEGEEERKLENYQQINLLPGGKNTLKFVPKSSGIFSIYSEGNDETINLRAKHNNVILYTASSNTGRLVKLSGYFEANKTYYIETSYWDRSSYGSFSLYMPPNLQTGDSSLTLSRNEKMCYSVTSSALQNYTVTVPDDTNIQILDQHLNLINEKKGSCNFVVNTNETVFVKFINSASVKTINVNLSYGKTLECFVEQNYKVLGQDFIRFVAPVSGKYSIAEKNMAKTFTVMNSTLSNGFYDLEKSQAIIIKFNSTIPETVKLSVNCLVTPIDYGTSNISLSSSFFVEFSPTLTGDYSLSFAGLKFTTMFDGSGKRVFDSTKINVHLTKDVRYVFGVEKDLNNVNMYGNITVEFSSQQTSPNTLSSITLNEHGDKFLKITIIEANVYDITTDYEYAIFDSNLRLLSIFEGFFGVGNYCVKLTGSIDEVGTFSISSGGQPISALASVNISETNIFKFVPPTRSIYILNLQGGIIDSIKSKIIVYDQNYTQLISSNFSLSNNLILNTQEFPDSQLFFVKVVAEVSSPLVMVFRIKYENLNDIPGNLVQGLSNNNSYVIENMGKLTYFKFNNSSNQYYMFIKILKNKQIIVTTSEGTILSPVVLNSGSLLKFTVQGGQIFCIETFDYPDITISVFATSNTYDIKAFNSTDLLNPVTFLVKGNSYQFDIYVNNVQKLSLDELDSSVAVDGRVSPNFNGFHNLFDMNKASVGVNGRFFDFANITSNYKLFEPSILTLDKTYIYGENEANIRFAGHYSTKYITTFQVGDVTFKINGEDKVFNSGTVVGTYFLNNLPLIAEAITMEMNIKYIYQSYSFFVTKHMTIPVSVFFLNTYGNNSVEDILLLKANSSVLNINKELTIPSNVKILSIVGTADNSFSNVNFVINSRTTPLIISSNNFIAYAKQGKELIKAHSKVYLNCVGTNKFHGGNGYGITYSFSNNERLSAFHYSTNDNIHSRDGRNALRIQELIIFGDALELYGGNGYMPRGYTVYSYYSSVMLYYLISDHGGSGGSGIMSEKLNLQLATINIFGGNGRDGYRGGSNFFRSVAGHYYTGSTSGTEGGSGGNGGNGILYQGEYKNTSSYSFFRGSTGNGGAGGYSGSYKNSNGSNGIAGVSTKVKAYDLYS